MLYKIDDPEFVAMVEKGVPIEELERRMRPDSYSRNGFLGKDESLLDVVHGDEETVRRLGLTHEQIADRLEYFIKEFIPLYIKEREEIQQQTDKIKDLKKRIEASRSKRKELSERGITIDEIYSVFSVGYRGFQGCPWDDDIDHDTGHYLIPRGAHPHSDREFTVKNTKLDESLFFPGLVVHLIREHHFYEGIQSPYRVDPEQAVRVLGIT